MKKMITTALFIGAFSCASAQAILYSQDFEGNSNDIYADGWEVVNLYANSPSSGIFNPSPSIQAMGFTGKTIGASTFDVIGTKIIHVPLTDVVIKSKEYAIPAGPCVVSFRLGSIAIGANATSHYSVYIMTAAELTGFGSTAYFKAILDDKNPAAAATIMGQSSIVSLDLTSYAGLTVGLVFRLHNSPTNSFMLFDDFVIKGGTLGTADFDAGQFFVYPNPATDKVIITASNGLMIERVTVSDMNGRTVKTGTSNDTTDVIIDTSGLASGTYMLDIASQGRTIIKKIVKI